MNKLYNIFRILLISSFLAAGMVGNAAAEENKPNNKPVFDMYSAVHNNVVSLKRDLKDAEKITVSPKDKDTDESIMISATLTNRDVTFTDPLVQKEFDAKKKDFNFQMTVAAYADMGPDKSYMGSDQSVRNYIDKSFDNGTFQGKNDSERVKAYKRYAVAKKSVFYQEKANLGHIIMDTNFDKNVKQLYTELEFLASNNYITGEQYQKEVEALQNLGSGVGDAWIQKLEKIGYEVTEEMKKNADDRGKRVEEKTQLCSNSCSPKCYYEDLTSCTFCPLFATFFNTASSMAKKAMDTFAGSVVQVVIIAFAIWLAILVLGFISSIETRDIKDLASSILQQGFLVTLVIILLQTGGSSFFNLVLTPIYTTGMSIAQTALKPDLSKIKPDGETLIVTQGDNSEQLIKRIEASRGKKLTNQEIASYTVVCEPGKPNTPTYIYDLDKGALPKEMGESILCTMTMIQNQSSKVKALGSSAICYSWQRRFLIFPHLGYLLTGIGLWVGGMILIIAVPFLMIDAVLELAVAAALLPAAIGAYAFKITRRYSKPVWDTFLNSMFVFMFVSLIALMLTTAFEMVLLDSTNGSLDALIFGNNFGFEKILDELGWSSVTFLKLCFALILTWTVMGEAKDFAGQFSGSISSTAIGSQIGTMAGSFTKSAVKKMGAPVAEAAGDHLWRGGGNLLRKPAHLINRARQNISINRVMKHGTRNGNIITYGNRSIKIDENGNKVLESTKQKTVRNAWGKKLGTVNSTKIQNKHFSVTVRSGTLNDGTAYQRDIIKLNSNAIRNLYNRRGQVNQRVYDKLLESCGEDQKLKIALMKQIVHHNMPGAKHNTMDHQYLSQEPIIENGQVIGYVERLPDGSKVEVILRTNEAGRMMTQVTQTDAKGKGVRLATDGLTNMKGLFKTLDGTADGQVDNASARTLWSASAHYNNIKYTGRYKREVLKEGMLGLNEENWDNFRRSNDTLGEFRSTAF